MKTLLGKFRVRASLVALLALMFLAVPDLIGANTTSASLPNHAKSWTQMTGVEKSQMVLLLSFGVTMCVAEIWFIVAGFKSSVGWGLFMLFIGGFRSVFAALAMIAWMVQWLWLTHDWSNSGSHPFKTGSLILGAFVAFAGIGALVFFTRHWEQARKPLGVMALGVILVLAAIGLEFVK